MSNHIKIYGVKPRIQYVANGTLTEYEFPFAIFKPSDIDVYFNDKLQDQSAYTVATVRDIEGGSVIFETAPTNGIVITIVRNLSIERTTDFQEGGALRAKVLNDELDYQIACQQQIADNLNRSMVMPPYAIDSDVDLTLPTPSAGRAIVWNSEGTNLENSVVKVNELESTLRGYKESAKADAETATVKSAVACEKADIASEQAQIATQKADEAKETLNAKVNKDMDNVSTIGKDNIVSFGMPDWSSGVSKNFETVYQAESNGYILFWGCFMNGQSSLEFWVGDSEDTLTQLGYLNSGDTSWVSNYFLMPIAKGKYYKGVSGPSTKTMIFYPCLGG